MLCEDLFHPATRAMLATARALARNEPTPPAAKAEPGLADRLFAIERFANGQTPVRAFGDALPALFGRDLRGEDFATLFFAPDRALFLAFLDAADAAKDPAVMRAEAETVHGAKYGLEILFAPLDPATAGTRRHVAMLQPLEAVATDLGAIALLRIVTLSPPAARAPLRGLRLVVDNR